jgi:FKBP-type peptidyl-prolyl cis-trans isomerase SlyD
VTLRYAVFDGEGECVAETDRGSPSCFLFGNGELPPALERALTGLGSGARKSVLLEPEEAFGTWDPSAVITIDRSELPSDVRVGDRLVADHRSGGSVSLWVRELSDDQATVDTNHPLAGQAVRFEVVIEKVAKPAKNRSGRAERRRLGPFQNVSEDLIAPGRLLGRAEER